MKARILRAMILDDTGARSARVYYAYDGFRQTQAEVPYDAVVLARKGVSVADVRAVRQEMPGIPLVVVADARSDLGCERICTDHAPLVVVREPGGKIKFDRVMPALYAAVKGSIEP